MDAVRLATFLRNEKRKTLVATVNRQFVVSAVGQMSDAQWEDLVNAVAQRDPIRIGTIVLTAVRAKVDSEADSAISAILADSTITLDEILSI